MLEDNLTDSGSIGREDICFHQVARPYLVSSRMNTEGVGDCITCKHDPVNNPRCGDYVPYSSPLSHVPAREKFMPYDFID